MAREAEPATATALIDTIVVAGLHQQRTQVDLFRELTLLLTHVLPEHDLALFVPTKDHNILQVALVLGPVEIAVQGESLDRQDVLSGSKGKVHPLRYRGREVSWLLVQQPLDAAQEQWIEVLLAHAAIAYANLQLNAEALDSADSYCAALQVLEEGIGLFQEAEQESISARFLNLATNVLGTQFGATVLCEKIGDPASPLRLDQTFGIPETFLTELRTADGRWWIETLPREGVVQLRREANGSLAGLPAPSVPQALHNLVICPLAYHGITAGLCLLLNAPGEAEALQRKLESLLRLGELGGALFHRLALESEALRSKAFETQMRIAAQIQKHLMPSAAPVHPRYEFAYLSRPAQHIGGDYVDLLAGTNGEVLAIIADISGHGINSALLMSSMRSSYRAEVRHRDLSDLFDWLNKNVIEEVADTGMFLTAAAFVLPGGEEPLRFVGAGHNPVLVWRAATGKVEEVASEGPPLGVDPLAVFPTTEVRCAAGDVILLYTDGIPECWSVDGQDMFTDERLLGVLVANATQSAEQIKNAILADVETFNPTGEWNDDVSLCVIKVR